MDTKKYYRMYFAEFKDSIKKALGWKELLSLCVSLVVGVVFYWLFIGVDSMKEEIINFIAFSLIPAGLLSIGYIVFHIIQTHVNLYRRKEIEANKYTWKDIEIIPYHFDRKSGMGVGLEIISDKSINNSLNITKEHVEITHVIQNLVDIAYPNDEHKKPLYLCLVSGHESIFTYGGWVRNRNEKDASNNHTVLPIANWDDNEAWIVSSDGKSNSGINLEKGITCEIVIHMKAQVNMFDEMLRTCEVFCDLFCDKDKEGHMKVFLELKKRIPDYELW